VSESAPSKRVLWTGRVLSALPSLVLLMSASMKLFATQNGETRIEKTGWQPEVMTKIGVVELCCLVLYLVPQTAVLGAVLLTGYLGGAIATHVHAGDGIGKIATPLVVSLVAWAGLYLREPRLKALLPLRR
jgi:hypothetical protein